MRLNRAKLEHKAYEMVYLDMEYIGEKVDIWEEIFNTSTEDLLLFVGVGDISSYIIGC